MPITLQLDRGAGIVRTKVAGEFTLSDVRRYLGQAVDARVYDYPEIVDLREAGPMVWKPRELLASANLIRDAFAGRRVPPRVMVVSTASHFGQARMFAGFLAGWIRIAVFDDMDEAEHWLASQTADQEA